MESKVSRRLTQPTAAEVCEHIYLPRLMREFGSGFRYLTDINQAHLLMLHGSALIPADVAAVLAQALLRIETEGAQAVALDPAREDAYFNYEAHLMQIAGADAGGRLHVARSRNDILATHDRLRARDLALDLLEAMLAVRTVALDKAEAYADVVMPGYTHLQAAQPITYGYYLAGVAEALGRDITRMQHALAALDACPLGAGALAGTAFAIDREATARWLGFSTFAPNSLDAVASRDFAWEMLSAITIGAVSWGRVAQDLYIWATPEFGLIDFPDSVAGTSSIMPQKKNPVVLEYLKGKGGHMLGLLTGALAALKGSHFTHSGDGNRESMRGFWEAGDECLRCLSLLRLVIDTATPQQTGMLTRASRDFSTATDLADALVRDAAMSFRQAHHVVGAVVRDALDQHLPASEISAAMVDEAAMRVAGRPAGLDAAAVARCLDPRQGVAARMAAGGPAPALVRANVTAQRAATTQAQQARDATCARLDTARDALKRSLGHLASLH
ncbi:argininosuccinate lyase [Cupriavidus sp. TA19]|uniref:argininosuccinate lyase n=1 Tax=unclassified Cupriavidus TaxID=2640874 RepID=UPI000E2F4DA4|nr:MULTISPECIES: argininosuccinate lyase [unclassified Cupriavidus]BDB28321.1 argininosuccinate lyase [Cupriavidus sp. P-10]GLC91162.1 argininosuccinate lyase [Cupriavidus sp. TA19]